MIVAGSIGLLVVYGVACWFTAENLALAWWHEACLARRSLAACDALCSANPRSADVVVTLTTIPSRIDLLVPTLKSLLTQTVRPTVIRVCVPEWSQREQRPYLVPDWLRSLANVRVVACADEGPATKFLSTLAGTPPEALIVVVDDDRIYHPRLLETFGRLAAAHPNEIIAGAGWSVPADLIDRPTTLRARLARAPHVPIRANQVRGARRVDIVQGVHGYAVRPRFFDLSSLGNLAAAPRAVRFVDDVWISAHALVACRVHPMRIGYTDFKPWRHRRAFNASALGGNVNAAPRDEDRGNSIALRYFAARWQRRSAP